MHSRGVFLPIFYDTMSPIYDDIYQNKDYELEADQVLKLACKNSPSFRLIDIGCGTGNHANFFSNTITYTGIDINKNTNVHFFCGMVCGRKE